MIIFPVHNKDIVDKFFLDPFIYNKIKSDNDPDLKDFDFNMDDSIFLCGVVDNEPIGIMFYKFTGSFWRCHPVVLPKYRGYSYIFIKLSLKWFWENVEVDKLYTLIPEYFPNVLKFAKYMGFKLIDTVDGSFVRNGESFKESLLILERP